MFLSEYTFFFVYNHCKDWKMRKLVKLAFKTVHLFVLLLNVYYTDWMQYCADVSCTLRCSIVMVTKTGAEMTTMMRTSRKWQHETLVCQTVKLILTDNLGNRTGAVYSNGKPHGAFMGKGFVFLHWIYFLKYLSLLIRKGVSNNVKK